MVLLDRVGAQARSPKMVQHHQHDSPFLPPSPPMHSLFRYISPTVLAWKER